MATSSGSKSKAKFLFIGGGVVAAVALVVFFQNYPPKPADATGTIGAADRYHAQQITAADVNVTPDEITNWLQSDTFDRIVKDPQARALFTSEATLKIMGDSNRRLVALGDSAQRSVQMAAEAQTKMVAVAADAAKVQIAPDAAKVQIAAVDAAKVMQFNDEAKKMVALESQANAAAQLASEARNSIQAFDEARKMVAEGNAKVQIVGADARMVQFLDEAKVQMVAFEDRATQMAKFSLDARGKYLAADGAKVQMTADQALKMADESRKSIAAFSDDARKSIAAYDAALKAAEADGLRKVQSLSDGANLIFSNEALRMAIGDAAFCQAVGNGAVQNALVAEARRVQVLESGARPE